jgi:hypothetical protein
MVASTSMAGVANAATADTLTISQSTATAVTGVPVTIAFGGSDTPYDSSGHTPALYALVRGANGVGCQPTFGQDQLVAGSDDVTVLQGAYGPTTSDGTFNYPMSYTPAAGSYTVCAWLETDGSDGSGSGDVASEVVTATANGSFTVPAPIKPPLLVCVVPRYRSATLRTVEVGLLAAHCTIGRIRYVRDHQVRRGRVIRLSGQPGSTYANRTKIAIIVSKG